MPYLKCAFCLLAMAAVGGGWSFRAAIPEEHYRRALHCLRTKNAERLQYELLNFDERPEFESRACLLRAWLALQPRPGDEVVQARAAWADLVYAVEDEKVRPLALALMGRSLYEAGRLNEAVALLSQALEFDPDEPEAHRCLGVVFYDLGLSSAALIQLRRLAALEPANGKPHRVMGLIYREQGEYQNAVDAYRESLTRDPTPSDLDDMRVELGRCLLALRRFDEGIAAVESCDTNNALVLRAECNQGNGDVAAANRWVAQALDRDPQDPHALAFKATLATVAGDARQAADLLAKAVRIRPGDYKFRYRLAQAYRLLGEDGLAEQQEVGLEELHSMRDELAELIGQASADISDVKLRYRIATIAERLGMTELAGHWFKAARLVESGWQPPEQAAAVVGPLPP